MLRLVRDPVLLKLNQLTAALKHFKAVKSWNAKLNVRLVHPSEVLVSSEHDNLVVDGTVGLTALKALNRVVKRSIRRVKLKSLVGDDLRLLPSSIVEIVVAFEHVIGLNCTEQVGVVLRWLRPEDFSLGDGEVTGQECLLHRGEAEARSRSLGPHQAK